MIQLKLSGCLFIGSKMKINEEIAMVNIVNEVKRCWNEKFYNVDDVIDMITSKRNLTALKYFFDKPDNKFEDDRLIKNYGLYIATKYGNLRFVKYWLEKGADELRLNETDCQLITKKYPEVLNYVRRRFGENNKNYY